jgi:hypothetical protein
MGMHVEYVGFSTATKVREYRLRAQEAGVFHDFVRAIPLEAFIARRARYQDAPEIRFLNLQRELAASDGTLPDAYLSITDARASGVPRSRTRRSRPDAGRSGAAADVTQRSRGCPGRPAAIHQVGAGMGRAMK